MRRGLLASKTLLLSVVAVSALLAGFFWFNSAQADVLQDCKPNSIITCGAQSPSEFVSKVRANAPGDLQAIYSDFGLVPSDYSKFVTSARMGMAYRNGTIVVDGQTVATDAWSIGRTPFSYTTPITINGKTYYKAMDTRVLLSDIPVMVLFNGKGQMQFAAMTACGNPAAGTVVTPQYSCDLLQKTPVTGKMNTYSFTTKASASNNASIVKVVYDFGDGTTATEANPSTPVSHTYAQSGTYTAKVTVYVSLPGNQTITVVSANCQTQITIAPPFQDCVALTALVVDVQQRSFRFTVATKQGNGAVLKDANFNFGDGTTANGVGPASDSTVVTDHTYAQDGTYNISATVDFDTFDGLKSVTCTTSITISPQMCAINPSVPANSPECTPCQFNNQIPANSAACQPPVTATPPPSNLPNTGAGGVVGMFLGSTLIAGIGYRLFLMRRLTRQI